MPIGDELLDAGQPRLLHQLDAHDRVLVEEAARVVAVGADAADDRGEVDDDVRPGRRPARGRSPASFAQVVLGAARDEDVVAPPRSWQPGDDVAAEEAGPAGHHDPSVGPERSVIWAPMADQGRVLRRHRAAGLEPPASRRSLRPSSGPARGRSSRGRQPSFASALVASPSSWSTSVGPK